MPSLVEKAEPDLLLRLVSQAQLNQCLVRRKPTGRSTKSCSLKLRCGNDNHAHRSAHLAHPVEHRRERLARQVSDRLKNIMEPSCVERRSRQLARLDLTPTQPGSNRVR